MHAYFSKYPLVAFETSGPAIKLFMFAFFSKANNVLKSFDNCSGETGISFEKRSGSIYNWSDQDAWIINYST